jgi:hypothetical protein
VSSESDKNLLNFIATTVEALRERTDTISDQMATKDDLRRLEVTMDGKFEQVYVRLDSIERGMGSRMGQIESEVSRLRSVVYLLVKDQPDMLRLLGPPTPRENRPQG